MYILCLSVVLFSFVTADPVKYQDCGSKAKITAVDVQGCSAEPCPFKRNSNETMKVTLTANENSKTAKTVLHGIIAGVPVPFPVPDDCCANKNLKCPIVQGQTFDYNIVVYVSPTYPKLRLLVKLEVQDDNGEDLICIIIPATITD